MALREMTDPNDPMARKALLDQMGGDIPSGMAEPQVEPQRTEAPPMSAGADPGGSGEGSAPAAPPSEKAPALDFSRMKGYDEGKFNANKQDAKYQMGRTLAQFDPRQGITPEVLDALNKLGYGTFSGQGDKLSLSGLTDLGRKNNLTGDYKDADFITAFKSGNGQWGYADPAYEAAHPEEAASGGGAMAAPAGQIVGGNPLETSGVPTDAAFFNKIMESLRQQAGPASYDRQALLSQMGAQ